MERFKEWRCLDCIVSEYGSLPLEQVQNNCERFGKHV